MIKYYKYLYYKILIFLRKSPLTDDTIEWGTMFIIFALMWLNILSLGTIYQIFTGMVLGPNFDRIEITVVLVIFFIPHYFLFLHKHKYEDIINEFKNESIEKTKKGNRYTIIYVVGTAILFFTLTIIKLSIWGKP